MSAGDSKIGAMGNAAMEGIDQAITNHKIKGRPPFHTETFLKQTVIMTPTAKAFIEDTVMALRQTNRNVRGKKPFSLDMSKFIRGVVLGVMDAHCNLDRLALRNEDELRKHIKDLLLRSMKAG